MLHIILFHVSYQVYVIFLHIYSGPAQPHHIRHTAVCHHHTGAGARSRLPELGRSVRFVWFRYVLWLCFCLSTFHTSFALFSFLYSNFQFRRTLLCFALLLFSIMICALFSCLNSDCSYSLHRKLNSMFADHLVCIKFCLPLSPEQIWRGRDQLVEGLRVHCAAAELFAIGRAVLPRLVLCGDWQGFATVRTGRQIHRGEGGRVHDVLAVGTSRVSFHGVCSHPVLFLVFGFFLSNIRLNNFRLPISHSLLPPSHTRACTGRTGDGRPLGLD